MGYRLYIGSLTQEEASELKKKKLNELLIDNPDYDVDDSLSEKIFPCVADLVNCEYELGKWFSVCDKYCIPFFEDKDVYNLLGEKDMRIISWEGILSIIEDMRKEVVEGLDRLATCDNKVVADYVYWKRCYWDNNYNVKPYNLRLDKEDLVETCQFEYQVFELVRVYKKLRNNNLVPILYGW